MLELCREKIIQSQGVFQEPEYCFCFSFQPPKCHFSPQKKIKPGSNLGLAPQPWNRSILATGSASRGHLHARMCGGSSPSKTPVAHQKHQAVSMSVATFARPTVTNLWIFWDAAVCPSHSMILLSWLLAELLEWCQLTASLSSLEPVFQFSVSACLL